MFCGQEYFMEIWDILCPFGTFFLGLVPCTKKNLATLIQIIYFESRAHVNNQRGTSQLTFPGGGVDFPTIPGQNTEGKCINTRVI
jgi:hypothetical protein